MGPSLGAISLIVNGKNFLRDLRIRTPHAVAVGVGMSGRGAVELIVAGIALRAGLFEQPDKASPVVENLFSAVVIVAIVTTLAVPILLRWVFSWHTKGT